MADPIASANGKGSIFVDLFKFPLLVFSNDAEYFRARSPIGVAPRGTRIRLAQTPEGIDRGYAVQYWAKIEVPGVAARAP